MADRATLHLSKLDEFATFAEFMAGYTRLPVIGDYEVLRLRKGVRPPLVFYARASATEHATIPRGEGIQLVRYWLRSRQKESHA